MAPTILQVIPELTIGGAERSVLEIVEALNERGWRALVAAEGGALVPEIEAAGGRLIPLPLTTKNPIKMIANAQRLMRLIRAEGVDLVHARSRAPAWSALWASRLAGVPFVTTYHGAYNQRGSLKSFYNSVMARGDKVIANSHYTAALIRARHAVNDQDLTVIYRGVDVAALDPQKVDAARAEAMREAWEIAGAPLGHKIILHPARLSAWKGQLDVIEASRLLVEAGMQNFTVVLAGDAQGRSAYEEELREKIKAYNLGHVVRLVGHVTDMAAAYKLADLVLVASREAEAFGRTAAEAQAMGCPVIATDIGAPPEFLNHAGNAAGHGTSGDEAATAWLVPPFDAAALFEKMAHVLRLQAAELEALKDVSRRYIAARFTADAMKQQTMAVYDVLLRGECHKEG